ncbi:MAG: sigma-70 family RNA polymerase sigma factor [Bacteroidetes bacterium]|nr:sigma-70 family RNA polymerase sigma factor [Bacteroidota bacterium]
MRYASTMLPPQTTVTQLLEAVGNGDRTAFDELYDLLHEELRMLAHRHRQRWRGDYTIDTVALVNEAYLKLVGRTSVNLKSRAHFLAVAAKAMRFILLDYAKRRDASKRPDPRNRVSFDKVGSLFEKGRSLSGEQADVLVALDEALKRLSHRDKRQSQVVECRFFGGMTIKETAAALEIATATVNRDWDMAKTWLYREIKRILGRSTSS